MRSFIVISVFLTGVVACLVRPENQPLRGIAKTAPAAGNEFEETIRPIMEKNCSPCHFTGGKMYERMPFDQDTTIIHHGASILKRIRDTTGHRQLKEFLSRN